MPLEIIEIQVTASVAEAGGNASAATSSDDGIKKDDIVSECVERVLEILKEKQED
ncbi:MAG: hypothetical protein GY751_08850 [Bacteroidetes bacterium]|nr:hypothetical protein [Bacteroidota bacterium]